MDIYCYMNQKMVAALKGEKTGIVFPYLYKIGKPISIDMIMKKVYLN